MNKHVFLLAILISLTACSSTEWQQREGKYGTEAQANIEVPAHIAFQQKYRGKMFSGLNGQQVSSSSQLQDLNYYVRGMMQDLVSNLQYVSGKTVMAVSSFVYLDGSYEYSDIVGKQLSESFVHEIHKYGIPIVDFKTTDYIRITPNGDFVLSKDFLDLDGDLPIKYVLTGTMVKQLDGYMVNARIIGIKSKAVVASAQGKLPNNVVNSLISSEHNSVLLNAN